MSPVAPTHVRRPQVHETTHYYILTAPYDPSLVRALRHIPACTFDRGSRTWRIPKTTAAVHALQDIVQQFHIRGSVRGADAAPALGSLQLALPGLRGSW
jgi:hypothetical protein